jgi:hypothetical protein
VDSSKLGLPVITIIKIMENWKEIPLKTTDVELVSNENVNLHYG